MSESNSLKWAYFRFLVIGEMLSSPPPKGNLQKELDKPAQKQWRHPITNEYTIFGLSTIERWWYQARGASDPVEELRRKNRSDKGWQKSIPLPVREALRTQHKQYPSWSYQLHYDNLKVLVDKNSELGTLSSYSSIRRYMKCQGMRKIKKRSQRHTDGVEQAVKRLERQEVRSYEMDHVNALWHLDFHHGSRQIINHEGKWVTPLLLGIIDDRSRLICHAQWYLAEDAECLIHGLCQGFQKRGLPRALMTDNGSAMKAGETEEGLKRLGVIQDYTLPYSPYQNGKQECFWGQVEGRLLPMLEGVKELDLEMLNTSTQAWVEMEYNKKYHSEINTTPIDRFVNDKDIGRTCPNSEFLRDVFTIRKTRRQRLSDGAITVDGVRYEAPTRYRNIEKMTIRYRRWNLSSVYLIDPTTEKKLCSLFPLNRSKNADGKRRAINQDNSDGVSVPNMPQPNEPAPLLKNLLEEYAATGLPPAYISKESTENHKTTT